jgi:hypothetical protein
LFGNIEEWLKHCSVFYLVKVPFFTGSFMSSLLRRLCSRLLDCPPSDLHTGHLTNKSWNSRHCSAVEFAIDLVHTVTIHQGDIISIKATLSGGGPACPSVYTISGNLCASEDVCSTAALRNGTLKNLEVKSLERTGSSFHIPSLQYK